MWGEDIVSVHGDDWVRGAGVRGLGERVWEGCRVRYGVMFEVMERGQWR